MNPDKTTNTQTNACRPQTQRNPNRVPKNQLAKLTNTLLSSQTTRCINPCGLEASGFAPCWGREPCPRRCFPVRFGPARSDVRELYTSSRPPKTGGSLKIVYAGQRPFSSEEAPRGPAPGRRARRNAFGTCEAHRSA